MKRVQKDDIQYDVQTYTLKWLWGEKSDIHILICLSTKNINMR